MRHPFHFLLFPCLMALAACTGGEHHKDSRDTTLRIGLWHVEMDLLNADDTVPLFLPFRFGLAHGDTAGWVLTIHNGAERIAMHEIGVSGDSVRIRLPLYDSEFRGTLQGDSVIRGLWHNHLRGDYTIPFVARAGDRPRFRSELPPNMDLSGEWKTLFSSPDNEPSPALGIFQQNGQHLAGTFATETGDHRFLEGAVSGDSLFLSVFNGTQANLFKAVVRNDSILGTLHGGNHYRSTWTAVRDPGFRLRSADSLTFLKEGHEQVDIHLRDTEGRMVSLRDSTHVGKVVLLQVLGTWCPNCVDEALLFQEFLDEYHDRGLRVIGISFERHKEEERALEAVERFHQHLDLGYPICYAGHTNKDNIREKLPFLDKVMSFPTSITIGRDGTVRRIHTGFYGPGTGERYLSFKQDMERMLERLLNEPAP